MMAPQPATRSYFVIGGIGSTGSPVTFVVAETVVVGVELGVVKRGLKAA